MLDQSKYSPFEFFDGKWLGEVIVNTRLTRAFYFLRHGKRCGGEDRHVVVMPCRDLLNL